MSAIELIKTEQTQRLERLIRMFENRNKKKLLNFKELNWSVFDKLFYVYLTIKDYQITFEPCDKGFDIGIYKKNGFDTAVQIDKLCTNTPAEERTIENIIDRSIYTAEYFLDKYINKVE